VSQLPVETRQDTHGHTDSLVSTAIQLFFPTSSASQHAAIPTSESICKNNVLAVLKNTKLMSNLMSITDHKLS